MDAANARLYMNNKMNTVCNFTLKKLTFVQKAIIEKTHKYRSKTYQVLFIRVKKHYGIPSIHKHVNH